MRDAFFTARRIVQELGWIAREQLMGRALARADGIPLDLDGVDAAWASEALGALGAGVRVREVERLEGHSGTTTRQQIRLTYAVPASTLPATLFVKLTPRPLATRLFGALFQLGRSEVAFYREVRASVPVQTPRVYCARTAARGCRFVLLLEDLAARGCRFGGFRRPLGLGEARAVVAALARLHAAFWESPRFRGDLAWLKSRANNPWAPIERFVCARSNAPALKRFGDLVPREVREGAHRIHAHRDLLEEHWAAGPLTLLHGDPHVANLYFDGEDVGFLDWQVVQKGQGVRDVAYFVINSLPTGLRREREGELLDHYVETLADCGVEGIDLGELWRCYRSHAMYVWISNSVTAAAGGLQPQAVVRQAIERAGAALEDLEAFELLDRLASRAA